MADLPAITFASFQITHCRFRGIHKKVIDEAILLCSHAVALVVVVMA